MWWGSTIGWNEGEFVEADNLLDILKQIYCRTVTLFADFASSCPELTLLEAKDKLALCSSNYCGVILFTLTYNAYLRNCNGLLFVHGFKYSLSNTKEDHDYDEFLQNLIDYLHRHVVRVFRETQITLEEYSILKTLILFSGVMPLTDAGNEVVLRARRKYAALLSEYIAATRPDLTSEEQMERLTLLFSTIPHMMDYAKISQ
ncbi:Ligand-binding domain of nuclear hormone receptor [Ancylostoma duodenale]|uniref:Ligand-binding domain of nuclear hormone receptor n=1 Tax=Ancylostoma duodenale TaxID=51022 RepID=A0A0C2GD74_9BILA|nr:Ligand-binding domain of nuclear hormone receptor [Ancylostoma duodenale]